MPMTWIRRVTRREYAMSWGYRMYPVPGVLTSDRRAPYRWATSTMESPEGVVMTAPTRAEFAERLLKGSVKKSYAPVVDIAWDEPLDPDKYFLPPKIVSLYGTPLW